ncbi:transposase [Haloechinothrix salitolerans]|uniref:Transposase n=1 Tax=Haloechinothrix salitolerans TaxID=926830 RepID=A0ABW2BZF3_9PSEU
MAAPKALSAAQSRLRALQRKAARQRGPYDQQTRTKRQPSKRWRRTQARIGKTHARAANVRRDVLHKATTTLAQQHQVICVETLNACGMRAKGGAYKRGLNRALADAALAEIRRMLGYKTRWYGTCLTKSMLTFAHQKATATYPRPRCRSDVSGSTACRTASPHLTLPCSTWRTGRRPCTSVASRCSSGRRLASTSS